MFVILNKRTDGSIAAQTRMNPLITDIQFVIEHAQHLRTLTDKDGGLLYPDWDGYEIIEE